MQNDIYLDNIDLVVIGIIIGTDAKMSTQFGKSRHLVPEAELGYLDHLGIIAFAFDVALRFERGNAAARCRADFICRLHLGLVACEIEDVADVAIGQVANYSTASNSALRRA
jgi:hypothetical protein